MGLSEFLEKLEEPEQQKLRVFYLDYEKLYILLQTIGQEKCERLLVEEDAPPQTHAKALASFMSCLREEVERLNSYCKLEAEVLLEGISGLFSQISSRELSMDDMEDLRRQARKLTAFILVFERFCLNNSWAFKDIVAALDETEKSDESSWFLPYLQGTFLCSIKFESFVVSLSSFWHRLRDIREAKLGSVWVPPVSFERKTTKFLIRPADVTRVKLLVCEHLPVLLFGHAENEEFDPLATLSLNSLQQEDSGRIASIYLDNEALDTYHGRMNREEGAPLLRVRWYGKRETYSFDNVCFLERKTHHEHFVMSKSIKERIQITSKESREFVFGKNVNLIAKTSADLNPVAVEKKNKLAGECCHFRDSRKLIPSIRTVYNRTAFQNASNNDVRISIDTNVHMFDELNANYSKTSQQFTSVEEFPWPSDHVHIFPYAILEIKLKMGTGPPPDFIKSLVDSDLLVQRHKFSKFVHATCMFHYTRIRVWPYWVGAQSELQEMSGLTASTHGPEHWLHVGPESKFHEDPQEAWMARTTEFEADSIELIEAGSTNDDETGGSEDKWMICFQDISPTVAYDGYKEEEARLQEVRQQIDRKIASTMQLQGFTSRRRMKIEPKTLFALDRTLIRYATFCLFLALGAVWLIEIGYYGLAIVQTGFATFLGVHVAIRHFRLRKAIRERRYGYQYDTVWVPTLVVVAMLPYLFTSIYYSYLLSVSYEGSGQAT